MAVGDRGQSSQAGQGVGRGRGRGRGAGQALEKHRLKNDNYSKILDWVSILENFSMLHGADHQKNKIGNKFLSKKTTFSQMLVALHAGGFNHEVKNGENL